MSFDFIVNESYSPEYDYSIEEQSCSEWSDSESSGGQWSEWGGGQ